MQSVQWHQQPDVVQMVLNKLFFFRDFANCRLVCKTWANVSLHCDKFWYDWLRYNVSWRSVKIDGKFVQQVNVLKTVPLHIQCFQRGIQKQIRNEKRIFESREREQRFYAIWLQRYTGLKLNSQKRLAQLTRDAVQIAEQRAAKKRRIMISKDTIAK